LRETKIEEKREKRSRSGKESPVERRGEHGARLQFNGVNTNVNVKPNTAKKPERKEKKNSFQPGKGTGDTFYKV